MKQILLITLAVLYALWPYDLLADLIPGWGWIDDAALLYLAWVLYRRWRRKSPSGAAGDSRSTASGAGGNIDEKDPYSILGVTREDPPEEVNRAYRRLAAQYHPDKVQHLGEEFQELAEKRFKEIQGAYDELRKQGRV